ncbi:MAG: YtxH domain-containing protein [Acidobacteriota bacterium]|nr:MAG: YtxH domain-containing protein [Acidobacteriota bacterium]
MSYEREREESSVGTKLTYLLIGGGIGAVLALLFAPKSGQELREDIADATKKGIERSKETAAHLHEAASDYYEVTREKASEALHSAQEKASEFGERARSAAAQTANPFSAAIEAGKEAYKEEKRRNEPRSISEGRPSYPVKEKSLDAPKKSPEDTEKKDS